MFYAEITSGAKEIFMTPLERVLATIHLEEADRVPCMPFICGDSRRVYGCNYDEWSKDGEIAAWSFLQTQEIIGFDAILTKIDLNIEAADFGQEIIYLPEFPSYPNMKNTFVNNCDDYLLKINHVDPTKPGRMAEHIKTCDILMNESGNTLPIFGFVNDPLGVLSIMRSPELLFSDCITHCEEVQRALSVITDVLEDYIRNLSKTGIPAIWIETIFGGHSHMNKKLWLKTSGNSLRRLADVTRECGMLLLAHSSNSSVYVDAHLEVLEPLAFSCAWLPDDCQSWIEAKHKWGKKLCLIGHVPPSQYLYLGTPGEVVEECRKEIKELAPGGGFILAPGWDFPHNASLLNAQAMVKAVELYGHYD